VLLHVLDGTSPDPVGDYKAIQLELELFNPALLDKPQVGVCVCVCVCVLGGGVEGGGLVGGHFGFTVPSVQPSTAGQASGVCLLL
jgi:hypothetical protein